MKSDLHTETTADRSALRWTDNERDRSTSGAQTAAADRNAELRDDATESVSDRRDVRQLEAELDRKEEQLRYVTDQYERLLEKKNRQLADDACDPVSDRRTTLRARLERYLPW